MLWWLYLILATLLNGIQIAQSSKWLPFVATTDDDVSIAFDLSFGSTPSNTRPLLCHALLLNLRKALQPHYRECTTIHIHMRTQIRNGCNPSWHNELFIRSELWREHSSSTSCADEPETPVQEIRTCQTQSHPSLYFTTIQFTRTYFNASMTSRGVVKARLLNCY